MKIVDGFGLYGILTVPVVGYSVLAVAMVRKKVRFIQLRMKDDSRDHVFTVARRLRQIIGGDSLFIINDDPMLAVEVGADGVHLGQDDMSIEDARLIMGPGSVIGLSTHNPNQTIDACQRGADYIGVGPVYATPTKANPDSVIGIDGMRRMLALATVPAVVLGGIDATNILEVVAAGARNVSAVRWINRSADPDSVIDDARSLIAKGANRV